MTNTYSSAKRWNFLQLFPFSGKLLHLRKYIKYFKHFTSLETFWRFQNFYIFGNFWAALRNLTILKKPFHWPFYQISMNVSPLAMAEVLSKIFSKDLKTPKFPFKINWPLMIKGVLLDSHNPVTQKEEGKNYF